MPCFCAEEVDEAGSDGEAGGVDRRPRGRGAQVADRGNRVAAHANVRAPRRGTGPVDDISVTDQERIVGRGDRLRVLLTAGQGEGDQ